MGGRIELYLRTRAQYIHIRPSGTSTSKDFWSDGESRAKHKTKQRCQPKQGGAGLVAATCYNTHPVQHNFEPTKPGEHHAA